MGCRAVLVLRDVHLHLGCFFHHRIVGRFPVQQQHAVRHGFQETVAGQFIQPGIGLGAGAPSPGDEAERAELRASIKWALLELPARQRDVVILRLLQGLSTREVAERLRIAEGTVKATLNHGLKKLRNSMEVWTR